MRGCNQRYRRYSKYHLSETPKNLSGTTNYYSYFALQFLSPFLDVIIARRHCKFCPIGLREGAAIRAVSDWQIVTGRDETRDDSVIAFAGILKASNTITPSYL